MKVGNLTFINICGPINLVCGPTCCGNILMWALCYGIFGGFFIGMTYGNRKTWSDAVETTLWSLIGVVTFCFFYLILSDPGVPNQIIRAARGDSAITSGF